MKKLYAIKCRECNEEFEAFVTFNRLQELLIEERCTNCGGELYQKMTFGGYNMKTGSTRRPT